MKKSHSYSNPGLIHLWIMLTITLCLGGSILDTAKPEEYLKLGAQSRFECVGMVADSALRPSGSCILIGPSTVLTAAHLRVLRSKGEETNAVYCKFNGRFYKVKEICINPQYKNSEDKSIGDIAVLKLEQPVNSIRPAALYKGEKEKGSIAYLAGYGPICYAGNYSEKLSLGTPRAAGQNTIDSIGGAICSDTGKHSLLAIDMDHPFHYRNCNPLGSPAPLPLEYIPVAGDSGGGLFIMVSGEPQLAGVVNLTTGFVNGMGNYGSIGIFARVSAYKNWIENSRLN